MLKKNSCKIIQLIQFIINTIVISIILLIFMFLSLIQFKQKWLLRFVQFSGKIFFLLPSKRKNYTIQNLNLCFPEKTQKERLKIARNHFAAIALQLVQFYHLYVLQKQDSIFNQKVEVHGLDEVKDIQDFFMCYPHFISISIAVKTANHLLGKARSVIMYKVSRSKFFNKYINRYTKSVSGNIVLHHQKKEFIKYLQMSNKFYGYSFDQDNGLKNSKFIDFFNIPTATLKTIPRLAKKYHKKIVFMYCILDYKDYTFKLYFEKIQFDEDTSDEDLLLKLNQTLEKYILMAPEQYYWLHRRFKTRPKGEKNLYA